MSAKNAYWKTVKTENDDAEEEECIATRKRLCNEGQTWEPRETFREKGEQGYHGSRGESPYRAVVAYAGSGTSPWRR